MKQRNPASRSSRAALGGPTPKPQSITPAGRRTDLRCPKCDGPMVIRANAKTPREFAGCFRYPTCKGTRPLP